VIEPLLVLDKDLRAKNVNRAFYRVFGITPAEMLGRAIYASGTSRACGSCWKKYCPRTAALRDSRTSHVAQRLARPQPAGKI
jgi:hypothetical protein